MERFFVPILITPLASSSTYTSRYKKVLVANEKRGQKKLILTRMRQREEIPGH